jgi:hypothetical protein
MVEIPGYILRRIADDARPVVLQWWACLDSKDRNDTLAAWDEQKTNRFFVSQTGDSAEKLPVVIGGRFVPAEQPLVGPEWQADYFEYLLKYPELLLCELPHIPIGGVCTAHLDARLALTVGAISSEFVCPLASDECPMRHLLRRKPNQTLYLTGPIIFDCSTEKIAKRGIRGEL